MLQNQATVMPASRDLSRDTCYVYTCDNITQVDSPPPKESRSFLFANRSSFGFLFFYFIFRFDDA